MMKMPSKSDAKQELSVRGVGRPRSKPPAGLSLQQAAAAAGLGGPPPSGPSMPMQAPPPGAMPMKNGGSASSRADGIAQRGKTKGTMVMCGGGMMKGK